MQSLTFYNQKFIPADACGDPEAAKHSKMLAERLNFTSEECENVYYMALLHDIGKIGVPNEIINSTSKLSDEEYAVIKTHPGVGYDILAEIKSRPDLSTGARWHHERFDGKGYPDGKEGEEIPFFASIQKSADRAPDLLT